MRKHTNRLGLLLLSAGVLVILALVLPSTFWWFALGLVLIAAGVCICKRG